MRRTLASFTLLVALACERPRAVRPDFAPKLTRGDLGTTFKTLDEAALAACAYLWQHEPRARRFEYCGAIYRDRDGIKAGLPETNDKATGCFRPQDPPGAVPEAGYHNHRQSEELSFDDRKNPTLLGCTSALRSAW